MKAGSPKWGVASLRLPGERESGDRCVVRTFADGAVVAVIDGLGHGPDAARAATAAANEIDRFAHEGLELVFKRCDSRLRETRGAAISAAFLDWRRGVLGWLGVGNVAGALVRGDQSANPRVRQLIVHGGVVGLNLPELHVSTVEVAREDALVLATDGVRSDFTEALQTATPPQPLAERILHRYASHNDDALVLVFPFNAAVA